MRSLFWNSYIRHQRLSLLLDLPVDVLFEIDAGFMLGVGLIAVLVTARSLQNLGQVLHGVLNQLGQRFRGTPTGSSTWVLFAPPRD